MDPSFEETQKYCNHCTRCDLSTTRKNVVFGSGNSNAKILFVGEGPGENEDLQGKPFVGLAGKLFDKLLATIYLDREKDLYLTNVVKCRPPKNRNPKKEECQACMPFLNRQIQHVNPKIIVCLGRIAAQELIKPDFKVTKEHGIWFEKEGFQIMGMYHPASILRNPDQKPDAFADFLILRSKIQELVPKIYETIQEEPPVPPKRKE